MLVFPNCKINIGLQVIGRRDDGYHELRSVFYPLPIHDALEIIEDTTGNPSPVTIVSGINVDGNPADNLCSRAWHLLKRQVPKLLPVKIYLHKAIPVGAGLGGGSADAAFTLLALNKKFQLGLTQNDLLSLAAQLGSDCPFFVVNTPCVATGRGERLSPVSLSLAGYQLVLVNPGIHISTKWAFAELHLPETRHPADAGLLLEQAIAGSVSKWKDVIKNDFEAPVIKHHPTIGLIKAKLYENGALFASMSGSGSTVFGIFGPSPMAAVDFPDNYFVRQLSL